MSTEPGQLQPSCSGPGSRSCDAPTPTATPSASASRSSSSAIPASAPPGTRCKRLYGLYLAEDRAGALAALDRFTDLYKTGQLPEFHHVVDTIIAWGDEILAFHDPAVGHASNGRLEGTNNKVLRRVAFGFTNRANCEARGILACPAIRSSPPRPTALTP
jgi:hypothetical protein